MKNLSLPLHADRLRELRAFEAHLRRNDRADGTVEKYLPVVADFAMALGTRLPGALTRADLEDYLEDWYEQFQRAYGRPPAPVTYRARITALKAFFGFLERTERLVDENGAEVRNRMSLIDSPKRVQKPIDFLTPEEDLALLTYRGLPHEELIVWAFRETGIRIGELRKLRIADIDLREPGRESLRIRESKTPAGRRTVPLSPDFVLKLESWFRHLRDQGRYRLDAPLLPTRNGGAAHATWITRVLKRVAANAGVRPVLCTCDASTVWGHAEGCPRTVNGENRSEITPHTLRRTYASHLFNKGMAIEHVSKLLGHRSVQITQQAYAELLDERVREEFNRVRGYGGVT